MPRRSERISENGKDMKSRKRSNGSSGTSTPVRSRSNSLNVQHFPVGSRVIIKLAPDATPLTGLKATLTGKRGTITEYRVRGWVRVDFGGSQGVQNVRPSWLALDTSSSRGCSPANTKEDAPSTAKQSTVLLRVIQEELEKEDQENEDSSSEDEVGSVPQSLNDRFEKTRSPKDEDHRSLQATASPKDVDEGLQKQGDEAENSSSEESESESQPVNDDPVEKERDESDLLKEQSEQSSDSSESEDSSDKKKLMPASNGKVKALSSDQILLIDKLLSPSFANIHKIIESTESDIVKFQNSKDTGSGDQLLIFASEFAKGFSNVLPFSIDKMHRQVLAAIESGDELNTFCKFLDFGYAALELLRDLAAQISKTRLKTLGSGSKGNKTGQADGLGKTTVLPEEKSTSDESGSTSESGSEESSDSESEDIDVNEMINTAVKAACTGSLDEDLEQGGKEINLPKIRNQRKKNKQNLGLLDPKGSSAPYLIYKANGNSIISAALNPETDSAAQFLLSKSHLYQGNISGVAAPLKKAKEPKPLTAGKNWFGMTQAVMTPELRKDIQAIKLRGYLDPSRFYKAPEINTKFLQVGTVVEGKGEFFSARIPKKKRKQNIVDEILADERVRKYSRKKFQEIQKDKSLGKKGFMRKKFNKSQHKWGKI